MPIRAQNITKREKDLEQAAITLVDNLRDHWNEQDKTIPKSIKQAIEALELLIHQPYE